VVFLGPPGGGKTHLAISFAIAAAESGSSANYFILADLITTLEEAQQAVQLTRRLRTLVFPSLMVIEEIGYIPIPRTGADLTFQLMSRRYKQAATVLASTKGVEEWGEIFGNNTMAAALIDRHLHHGHIVNIRGNSYRMRQHWDLALRRSAPAPEPPRGAARRQEA
jgi:DNA replication protein DnaC